MFLRKSRRAPVRMPRLQPNELSEHVGERRIVAFEVPVIGAGTRDGRAAGVFDATVDARFTRDVQFVGGRGRATAAVAAVGHR